MKRRKMVGFIIKEKIDGIKYDANDVNTKTGRKKNVLQKKIGKIRNKSTKQKVKIQ